MRFGLAAHSQGGTSHCATMSGAHAIKHFFGNAGAPMNNVVRELAERQTRAQSPSGPGACPTGLGTPLSGPNATASTTATDKGGVTAPTGSAMDTFRRDQQQQQQQPGRKQRLPRVGVQVPQSPQDPQQHQQVDGRQGAGQQQQQEQHGADVRWVLGGASTVLDASPLRADGHPYGPRLSSSGLLDTAPTEGTGAERTLRSGRASGGTGGSRNKSERRLPDVALTVAAGTTEEGAGPEAEAGQAGHRGSVAGLGAMAHAGECCSARRRRCGEAALQGVQVGRVGGAGGAGGQGEAGGRPTCAAHSLQGGGGG